jgi:hypothetical protein
MQEYTAMLGFARFGHSVLATEGRENQPARHQDQNPMPHQLPFTRESVADSSGKGIVPVTGQGFFDGITKPSAEQRLA